mmetsp:Transcript_42746/g.112644  ORF Transcript_42746/g.112644 Transcript_42746/m.112644 type:complete len:291 (-) Transcript_42746:77-949(-)
MEETTQVDLSLTSAHDVVPQPLSDIDPQDAEDLKAFKDQEDRKGVIYLTSVPYGLHVFKVRRLLERFGEIGRIYLTPHPRDVNKEAHKRRYLEGWVEFMEKKVAKRVAVSLNSQTIGGKKRDRFYGALWVMRYLPKFKWHNLVEHHRHVAEVKKARIQQQIEQVHKENQHFREQQRTLNRKKHWQKKKSEQESEASIMEAREAALGSGRHLPEDKGPTEVEWGKRIGMKREVEREWAKSGDGPKATKKAKVKAGDSGNGATGIKSEKKSKKASNGTTEGKKVKKGKAKSA